MLESKKQNGGQMNFIFHAGKKKALCIFSALMAAAAFCEIKTAVQDVNGFLPGSIFVRTMTQTFCKYYEFTLVDGRIYFKKPDEKKWKLFLNTGLPFSKIETTGMDEFQVPERIIEISADADSLYAFDSNGILYTVFLTKNAPEKPFLWKKKFGFPSSGFLIQNELVCDKRAWSMGSRRKDILYHSDIYGNEHHYGTMGIETLYFLGRDGQHIFFTDSGLPADFSRQIQVPLNGTFVSENLSASGDTVFLIGSKGTMFTRLIDFDTMGCDPMFFQYTYEKLEQKKDGTNYLSNYSPWALPAEDWLEQPKIPLEGKARLTKFIGISQNGQGNAARLLRVAGTDRDGTRGFYEKAIFDKEWNFVEAQLVFSEADFLDGSKSETGPDAELSYSGFLAADGIEKKEFPCSVKNVSLMSEGKCLFEISDGNETFSCTLFPVEKWTYIKRKNPGFDGTPRNYFITAEFDESVLDSYTGEFGEIIRKIFRKKNHELFAFSGEATVDYFDIEINRKKSPLKNPLSSKNSNYEFLLGRGKIGSLPKAYRTISSSAFPLFKELNDADRLLVPGQTYSIRERTFVQNIINKNYASRNQIITEMEQLEELKKNARHTRWGYSALEFFASITLLKKVNYPKIKQMTSFGGELMDRNYYSLEELAQYRNCIYPKILELINQRIENYEKIVCDFNSHEIESTLNSNLKNSFKEYYDAAGIPAEAEMAHGDHRDFLRQIPGIAYCPGYFYRAKNGTTVLILLENSAGVLLDFIAQKKDARKNPVVLKAAFISDEVSEADFIVNPILKNISRKKGTFIWNGEQIQIFVGKKLLFKG